MVQTVTNLLEITIARKPHSKHRLEFTSFSGIGQWTKMSFSLDFFGVELEMRQRKLAALEKGLITDFSFLVGPDKDTATVSPQFLLF